VFGYLYAYATSGLTVAAIISSLAWPDTVSVILILILFLSRNGYLDHGYQIRITAKNNRMIQKYPELIPVFAYFGGGVKKAPKARP
jgi:hypothetical protein